MSDFALRLRSARVRMGYSQEDLAAQIPCNRVKVAQWELDARTCNNKELARICRILDVSADYLLGLKGE